MKELNKNWLTEGLIDFEYKKYRLLAYLQAVKEDFNERKLYPVFSDLLFHYKNLVILKQNKSLIHENFPKEISGADFEKLNIMYKAIVQDDKTMQELEDIMTFSIPMFQNYLTTGKDIYEEIEQAINISPVGLFSLNYETGYLFFYVDNIKETKVYEYEITIFQSADEKYRGVHTQYLETVEKSLNNTFEAIKIYLIKKYKKLPNPATYLIDSKVNYPFDESLLPVAKRMLVRQLYSKAA